ncbi:hypothetical protein [Magnetospirillum molischianum]|uniref:Uncharacterized protein n=1 Tax=Magnetospirillum molischianum DSM 120 TaxID=1150626 RepID=H8FV13_MAGML|nr:hypothetical protein [Magnetospirillum molischianum]CCG42201.1 hypothetical protein PHAMO_340074 [Magnetospirillum molischianum DSM 120]
MLEHFLIAMAAHATVDISKEALKFAFDYVAARRPDLAKAAAQAEASGNLQDIEKVFRDAVGVIVAEASNGSIKIDAGVLEALNGIKFDHQHGEVQIAGARISSKLLVTGGGAGASGKTVIGGNTSLRSQGTSIEVGAGCSIVMTGGATIKQT